MTSLDLNLIGSFQRGLRKFSENPLAEVWSDIEYYGTKELLRSLVPDNPSIDWDKQCEYSSVRICQAIEYRTSAKQASILTAPLPVYYSMLNLVRAAIAIRSEFIPRPYHGLKYKRDDDLFENGALVTSGTFQDYLKTLGVKDKKITLTLKQCFARIPEIGEPFTNTTHGPSRIMPFIISIKHSGKITLRMNIELLKDLEIEKEWINLFPKLSSICAYNASDNTLHGTIEMGENKLVSAAEFCEEYFIPDLVVRDFALWYMHREDLEEIILPREVYYLAGMFILSNIVRYEPNIIAHAVSRDSEDGWLLRKFLEATDRYFPQLVRIWATNKMIRY